MNKKRPLTIRQKRAILGVLFVSPWIIGFTLLMAIPLIQSIKYSFSELTVTPDGYTLKSIGWENFRTAFAVDPNFNRIMVQVIRSMLLNVPMVIFFSLFAASLLVQDFKGRGFARAVFFLPVVLSSGIVAGLETNNYMARFLGAAASDVEGNFSALRSFELAPMLLEAGLSPGIVSYLTGAVDGIYRVVISSGIQIVIFLAGLQSIPPSLYEAAKIEGATNYEVFWKVTFPMVTPFILTNTIYTIINSFYSNSVTSYIHSVAFGQHKFGLSSAMAWVYFIIISLILIIITKLISKRVFYYE